MWNTITAPVELEGTDGEAEGEDDEENAVTRQFIFASLEASKKVKIRLPKRLSPGAIFDFPISDGRSARIVLPPTAAPRSLVTIVQTPKEDIISIPMKDGRGMARIRVPKKIRPEVSSETELETKLEKKDKKSMAGDPETKEDIKKGMAGKPETKRHIKIRIPKIVEAGDTLEFPLLDGRTVCLKLPPKALPGSLATIMYVKGENIIKIPLRSGGVAQLKPVSKAPEGLLRTPLGTSMDSRDLDA